MKDPNATKHKKDFSAKNASHTQQHIRLIAGEGNPKRDRISGQPLCARRIGQRRSNNG